MKLKALIATLSSAALVSGCATAVSDYCAISRPILFGSDTTVDWLADNDLPLLTDIVTHNEQMAALCK